MAEKIKKTKEAALVSLSLILGAAGGATVTELNDAEVIDAEYVVQIQREKEENLENYEQILKSGEKPSDAKDKTKIKDFPDNMHVDVYDGPKGKGYTIIQEVDDKVIYLGFGPEAEERTMIITKDTIKPKASSTEPIINLEPKR